MTKRNLGILFIVLGFLLAIVSLAADVLGIGWKQILGAVVGVLVALGGVWWGWTKTETKKN